MVTVTENFNGTNGTGLAAHNAAFVAVMGAGAFSLESDRLRCDAWTNVASRYNGSAIGSNQYAECVIRGTAEAFRWMGVIGRCASGAATFYAAYYEATTLRLSKFVAGAESILGANNSFSPSDGDVLRLECSGTTIRVLVNGSEEASATDSDIASGDPGVFGNGGAATTRIDDWEAGDLAGPDVTPPVISSRTVTGITSSAATVEWDTDEDADSAVDWGTAEGVYQTTVSDANLTDTHSISLTGLPSGVTIYYRVRSSDAASNEASQTGTFDTLTGGASTIDNVSVDRVTSVTARVGFTTSAIRAPTINYGYTASNLSETTGVLPAGTGHVIPLRGMNQGRQVFYEISADGATPVTGNFQLTAWSIPLAVNISELTHTAISKDHQKFARPWLDASYTEWVHGSGPGELPVDADGWPTTIPAEGVQTILHGATPGTTIDYPLGDYRIEWQGTGTIEVFVGGTAIETGPNHQVVRVTERTQDGIQYRILTTGTGGAHLRRLKSLEPGNWSTSVEHSDRLTGYTDPYRGGYRWMDPHDTNEKSDRPPAVSWDGTDAFNAGNTSEDRYTFHHGAAYGGFPYARTVAICNETNRPGWWCVPHTFDNASVQAMAEYLAANVRVGLKVRAEHSNEVWNGTFDQGDYALAQANIRGYTGTDFEKLSKYHGARTLEIADIFRTAFAARLDDFEMVLGGWAGGAAYAQTALTQIGSGNWSKIKALALGNYVGEYLGLPFFSAGTKAYTREQLHEELRRHLNDTSSIEQGTANEVSGVVKRIRDNKVHSDAAGIELWAYEGGLHLVGVLGEENDAVLTAQCIGYNRDPLAGDLEAEMYDVWRAEGGGLFARFNSIGPFTKFGSWGSQERQDEPNAKQLVSESLVRSPGTGGSDRQWNRLSLNLSAKLGS